MTRRRLVVKLGRVEADDAGERLAVGEAAVGRHQLVGMPRGHFDMIAENGVVPDLERADGGRIAIARFERGNCTAAVRCRIAQRVQIGVIAFRDVSALRGVDRRRGDQRARQLVDQTLVTAELRQKCVEQRRPVGLGLQLAPERIRRGQPVAKQREVARAPAAGRQPRERPRDVGHGLERHPNSLAADCIFVQPGDKRQPLLDRCAGRSAARRCLRTAAGGRPRSGSGRSRRAGCRRRRRSPTGVSSRLSRLAASIAMWLARAIRRGSVEQDARAFLRRIEIGEQPAGRGELGPRRRAEAVERGEAEAGLERPLSCQAVEPALAGIACGCPVPTRPRSFRPATVAPTQPRARRGRS